MWFTVVVKAATIEERASLCDIRCLFFHAIALREGKIASAVVVSRNRVVLNLDVLDLVKVVGSQIVLELVVSALLHLPQLFLSPHVEGE